MTSNCFEGRMKYVGLLVGCLGQFVAGYILSINSYVESIKEIFNYTEKECKYNILIII